MTTKMDGYGIWPLLVGDVDKGGVRTAKHAKTLTGRAQAAWSHSYCCTLTLLVHG